MIARTSHKTPLATSVLCMWVEETAIHDVDLIYVPTLSILPTIPRAKQGPKGTLEAQQSL